MSGQPDSPCPCTVVSHRSSNSSVCRPRLCPGVRLWITSSGTDDDDDCFPMHDSASPRRGTTTIHALQPSLAYELMPPCAKWAKTKNNVYDL